MTGKQIETIHFTPDVHVSPSAAARAARRCLARLESQRLVIRLRRRVGGVRAGSSAYVYAVGPVGERLLARPSRSRLQFREPSSTFARHTLAVTDVVVQLIAASRTPACDLEMLQPEPVCWRQPPGLGQSPLRPDLFVSLGIGDFEHRWFIEVDLGSEHLPTLLRKALVYQSYFQSGTEQAEHGVFPKVLWQMHSPERAARLSRALDNDHRLTSELFIVTTAEQAVAALLGQHDAERAAEERGAA